MAGIEREPISYSEICFRETLEDILHANANKVVIYQENDTPAELEKPTVITLAGRISGTRRRLVSVEIEWTHESDGPVNYIQIGNKDFMVDVEGVFDTAADERVSDLGLDRLRTLLPLADWYPQMTTEALLREQEM